MEKGQLVLKAMNGDKTAMEMLYKATYPKLRAVTYSILKNDNDVEDILQDSYIKAFSSLNQLEDPNKFEGWLCRIASNNCKNYLKKHKPVLFADMGAGEDDNEEPYEWSIEDESRDYNPEEVAISDDTRRILMELIKSLPDEQRICLVYFAVEEMKISEIASLLEVSESTVKSRLKYAKDKMKNKIEDLEKKGVKIRSVSGFALIPFLQYLFSTEAKAAPAVSFEPVAKAISSASNAGGSAAASSAAVEGAKVIAGEVVKSAGTKAVMGLGAKIAAGIVAAGVAIGVPVAVYKNETKTDNRNDLYETEYSNDISNDISNNNAVEEETFDDFSVEELNAQLKIDETIILDEESFMVKLLNIRIDENYNYILETEITNKTDLDSSYYVYRGYTDDVLSTEYKKICDINGNETQKTEIVIENSNLIRYSKVFSEIKLYIYFNDYSEVARAISKYTYEAKPIYPFGEKKAKKFDAEPHCQKIINSDQDTSIYLLDCYAEENKADVEVVFFIENRTDRTLLFETEDYIINKYSFDRRMKNANDDGTVEIDKNSRKFFTLTFDKNGLEDRGIYELKNITLYATLRNFDDVVYFGDIIRLDFETQSDKSTAYYGDEFLSTGKQKLIDNEYKTNVHFVKMGETCKYDLDGDGIEEEIYVTARRETINWPPYNTYYTGTVNATINGTKYRNIYGEEYRMLSNYYCIIDIDKADSKLHLAIQDYGFSNDYSTAIFEYSNGELNSLGSISGVFDPAYGFYDTVCNGDGTIDSYIRFSILQTWWAKYTYEFTDTGFEFEEKDYYEATRPYTHTLLTDLTVYEKPDLNSKKTVLSVDSEITLLGSDNIEWVKIKAENSKEYWMKVVDFGNVVIDGINKMDGYEVLTGLSYAD